MLKPNTSYARWCDVHHCQNGSVADPYLRLDGSFGSNKGHSGPCGYIGNWCNLEL